MYSAEHVFEGAEAHRIVVHLEMSEDTRSLEIRTIVDGGELEAGASTFQPGPDTIGEETPVDERGLHLIRTYVDEMRYRRDQGRNQFRWRMTIDG